jgi:hypothetical protein
MVRRSVWVQAAVSVALNFRYSFERKATNLRESLANRRRPGGDGGDAGDQIPGAVLR